MMPPRKPVNAAIERKKQQQQLQRSAYDGQYADETMSPDLRTRKQDMQVLEYSEPRSSGDVRMIKKNLMTQQQET